MQFTYNFSIDFFVSPRYDPDDKIQKGPQDFKP